MHVGKALRQIQRRHITLPKRGIYFLGRYKFAAAAQKIFILLHLRCDRGLNAVGFFFEEALGVGFSRAALMIGG